ncbi:unnamed protein product [Cyprideis torosa]|uniref:Uncharacterized protein n=1 Tax=Cyprideis torosa TaxID=163714 RepID=A0A7R8WAS9_9CRUS|nr:unnamed protein product [Cyprideis torosa]CAG0885634.1 unnamed protein product [Cyprideis torosa]
MKSDKILAILSLWSLVLACRGVAEFAPVSPLPPRSVELLRESVPFDQTRVMGDLELDLDTGRLIPGRLPMADFDIFADTFDSIIKHEDLHRYVLFKTHYARHITEYHEVLQQLEDYQTELDKSRIHEEELEALRDELRAKERDVQRKEDELFAGDERRSQLEWELETERNLRKNLEQRIAEMKTLYRVREEDCQRLRLQKNELQLQFQVYKTKVCAQYQAAPIHHVAFAPSAGAFLTNPAEWWVRGRFMGAPYVGRADTVHNPVGRCRMVSLCSVLRQNHEEVCCCGGVATRTSPLPLALVPPVATLVYKRLQLDGCIAFGRAGWTRAEYKVQVFHTTDQPNIISVITDSFRRASGCHLPPPPPPLSAEELSSVCSDYRRLKNALAISGDRIINLQDECQGLKEKIWRAEEVWDAIRDSCDLCLNHAIECCRPACQENRERLQNLHDDSAAGLPSKVAMLTSLLSSSSVSTPALDVTNDNSVIHTRLSRYSTSNTSSEGDSGFEDNAIASESEKPSTPEHRYSGSDKETPAPRLRRSHGGFVQTFIRKRKEISHMSLNRGTIGGSMRKLLMRFSLRVVPSRQTVISDHCRTRDRLLCDDHSPAPLLDS